MTEEATRQEEEQRLQHVLNIIRGLIERSEVISDERKSTVYEARKDFWDEISVNLSNPDDIMETYSSITQQTMMLAGQERSLHQAEDTRYRLIRMYHSPYFGRIDFTEEGTNMTDRIYIGISSVFDESTQDYVVYDWRAPISSLYYDYPPGPAAYNTPSGLISGTLELKRQYVIRGGRLKAMFDTGLTIGDEVLQQILGEHAEDTMKSIVATIQKEQNQIIRDERHQVLIVQGAAGSGKTSVALQRVAYLLYKHRDTLNADNMVLFSPNALFSSYVSTVLPELGEANMQQMTYYEYIRLRLGNQYEIEDGYDQLEYLLTKRQDPGYAIRQASIRFKSSAAFVLLVEHYAKLLEKEAILFEDILFQDRVLITGERIKEQFYALDPDIKLSNKLQLLKDWLIKELKALAIRERKQNWVKDAIELLDKEDYQRAYQLVTKRSGDGEASFYDSRQEEQILAKFVVHEAFKPLRRAVKKLGFISTAALYKQLFASESVLAQITGGIDLPEQWEQIRESTLSMLADNKLSYEDATPLLYLNELIEGFQTYQSVKHVLIDEAQDYTSFQWVFLKRLFPRAKFTLLGDFNQSIYPHGQGNDEASGYSVLYRLFPSGQIGWVHLHRSYRSTKPIVEFTKGILKDGQPIEPFNREGCEPEWIRAESSLELALAAANQATKWKDAGLESIAIVCKTAQECELAHRELSAHLSALLITKQTKELKKTVIVIPAYLAKGLEFDAVIIYDGSQTQYSEENERKLLYTACTRAMHRLTICYTGHLSPLFPHPTPYIM